MNIFLKKIICSQQKIIRQRDSDIKKLSDKHKSQESCIQGLNAKILERENSIISLQKSLKDVKTYFLTF